MKLHLEFDADLIRKYVNRGASPIFTIYWAQDQIAYPEDQWLDFGSVVLSWWLVAAKSLLTGASEAEFAFMDGPFQLQAQRVGNMLYISADEQSVRWQISIEAFVTELLKAAYEVKRKFADMSIPDEEGLQVGARDLEIAMSEARRVNSAANTLVQNV